MIDDMLRSNTSATARGSTDTYVSGVEFFVLGPVEHRVDDSAVALGGPKQRAVLAHLLARLGDVVTLESLIVGVWGPDGAPSLRSSVHTYISNLRVIIGYEIERIGDGYRLNAPPDATDAFVFERMVDDAERQRSVNPAMASHLARQALAVWRGRAYADLADVHGLQSEIRRLDDARLRAVELRIDTDIELGRHRAVIGELEALTVEHPLNEGLHAKLMLALYRDGRQAEALRIAGKLRAHLAESLGVDPTPALIELEDQILQHDPALDSLRDARSEDLAFLFTDIEESTSLWESQPEWMRVSLARHDTVIVDSVERNAGTVVKHTGDGVIAVFASAKDAVGAATRAQRELATLDWGMLGPLKVRMAVDAGEVEVRNADYFGTPMNRGARLQSSAHGGQILLSSVAHERLTGLAGIQTRNLGEYRLKGIGTPQRVFQLVAEGLPSEFPDLRIGGRGDDADGRTFGDTIRGYELRERVGAGRFGVVYRAYQPSIGREVAVKLLPETVSNHPSFIRTFERDARLVAKLAHPHIVPLFDFWRDEAGAYFVMPFLPGSRPAPETRLPMARVAKVVDQVGSALSYAHRHGVLHRDLDPDSLLFDTDGNAYLSGFRIGTAELDGHVTDPHADFCAPERQNGGQTDERTDVYGLGAVAAYLITGQTIGGLDLSQVPAGDVLAQATATAPDQRFSTIDDFVVAFPTERSERPAPVAPSRNPYKGLAAFDEEDARDFFGRDEQISTLVDLVRAHRLVTVVGPSGSGKSSLVRAGLLPALRAGTFEEADRWLPVVMLPGAHPFDELLTALGSVATENLVEMLAMLSADDHGLLRLSKRIMRDLDGELLLVIDQFEELYTLLTDSETRDRFVASLVAAIEDPRSRLRVVITVRADFFDQPLLDDRLGPLIARTNLAVATPAPTQLLEAITGPAEAAGLEFEGGLAERIVEDVRTEPGGLPLMQFTLQALADASLPGWLTHEKYAAIGGVTGALSARADEVFGRLNETDQVVAQRILLRLVSVSEENDDVRRRVRKSDLDSLASDLGAVDRVLGAFGAARLLTFDRDPTTRGPTVEVAHEALLREWDRFRDWVDEQRGDLIIHRRFSAAMDEWRAADESEDHLPTGGRLAQFEEWFPRADPWLSETERAFLRKAVERHHDELARRQRRRRAIVAGFAAAAMVATVFGIVAAVQRSAAVRDAAVAGARELVLEAENLIADDPELAVMLSLEAAETLDEADADTRAVTRVLREANAANHVVKRLPGAIAVAAHPNGDLLATADGSDVIVVEIDSGETIERYEREEGEVREVTFSPDGRTVLAYSFGAEPTITLWDRITGEARHFGNTRAAWDASFSPDGRTVGFTTEEQTVQLWDTQQLQLEAEISGGAAFDISDAGRMVVGVCEVDLGCEAQVLGDDLTVERRFPVPIDVVWMTWSPDEALLAVSNTIEFLILDAENGTEIATSTIDRPGSPIWISDDSVFLGAESNGRIIDAYTGEVSVELLGLRGTIDAKASVPQRSLLAVAGDDDQIVLFESPISEIDAWRVDIRAWTIGFLDGGDGVVVGAQGNNYGKSTDAFAVARPNETSISTTRGGADTWFPWPSGAGGWVPMYGNGGRWQVYDADSGEVVHTAERDWAINAVSDDGMFVLEQSSFGIPRDAACEPGSSLRIVDRRNDGAVELTGGVQCVAQAAFSADASRLALYDPEDELTRVYDTVTGDELGAVATGIALDLSNDGSTLVVGSWEGTVHIYDVDALAAGALEAEAELRSFSAHSNLILRVRLSPDGRLVATSAWDEPLRVWGVATAGLVDEFGGGDLAGSIHDAAFHPTEPWIAVTYPPDTIRVHTLDLEELMMVASQRLTRTMTDQECSQYLRHPCDSR